MCGKCKKLGHSATNCPTLKDNSAGANSMGSQPGNDGLS